MLSKNELGILLADMESDRIERTVSINNTDKFCEAICAFSNDFPNNKQNGYLIIGVDDKTGIPVGSLITDNVLKNLAAIRDDGNVLPKPALIVQRYEVDGQAIAVVEVLPSLFPPVRYKGRVWIRNGPRKAIATEAEERILSERRTSSAKTFDALPCAGSKLEDLNLDLFKFTYLPNAIDSETLAKNHREIKSQLASLRLYDLPYDSPTNGGIILLCDNAKYYFMGAYVQYVKFSGIGMDSEILNEKEFVGDLISVMRQLDDFVKNNIEFKSVYISALKEEVQRMYPFKAIRELLNNAIMHRNYESNAPVKFYEFTDRIEITNPGGLYGAATPDNFPSQNDYRNPILAEALKVLGYVNKFNRGVDTAKSELKQNGNPEPIFTYNLPLHFSVVIYKKELR
ncbi:RNA-binding domain-containing protein [Arcicella rigui]|uniref:ATP-binding protein n=1 Tax=Arcicella rigui TaxID=797020 RepID=A0ABU5QFT3_9BACT|nr:ATP-binding protein [Arcicella rigui]MEA5141463.1 ATP-binding protein [Arcicella rigui]